jgi:hypothetical protein
MPFQSEKQRRFLHANHPEIAKRWEREYATGGISNHFRKKFDKGSDYGQFERRQAHNVAAGSQAMNVGGNQGNGNQGDGGGPKPHVGPTLAEIEAQKKAAAAAEEARLQALEDARRKQIYDTTMAKRKKNIKYYDENLKSKFDTPTWDTDITEISLYEPNATLNDYYERLDEGEELNFFEQQHLQELENQNRQDFKKEFKEKEGLPTEKLMYPPPRNLAKLSTKGLIEYNKLINKKNQNEATDGLTPALTDKEKERLKQLEKDKESKLTIDSVTMIGAKGGVARKNYFHGGILDITGDEEITTDDGNDIELTAYNAEFDDPKDLSTGVKTLFQAKDGGRIGFANGPPGGGDPGMYSAASSDRGPRDDPDRFGPVSKPQTVPAGINIHADTGKEPEAYVMVGGQQVPQSVWGTSADPREKYDSEEQMLDLTYAFNPTGATKKHTYITNKKKAAYEKSLADQKAKLKKMGKGKLFKALALLLVGLPPEMVIKEVMISPNEIKTLIEDSIPVMQAKKDYMTALGNAKADYETLGMASHHHAVDTEIQTIDQTLLDLTKPKDKEEKGDGPEPPVVIPVQEEIDAYAQSDYYMSPWERIKANQAKRAMLVEKGVIQENPVVDESVTDIVMEANSGGLANLFRVKNQ